jgi:hypothetical protein
MMLKMAIGFFLLSAIVLLVWFLGRWSAHSSRPNATTEIKQHESSEPRGAGTTSDTAPEKRESINPRDAGMTYVSALLSTVAEESKEISLIQGQPLPRLEAVTRDPGLLAWETRLPSDSTERLTSDFVIGMLRGLAKLPFSDEWEKATDLHSKLIVKGGLKDVSFRLIFTKAASGARKLDIRLNNIPGDFGPN